MMAIDSMVMAVAAGLEHVVTQWDRFLFWRRLGRYPAPTCISSPLTRKFTDCEHNLLASLDLYRVDDSGNLENSPTETAVGVEPLGDEPCSPEDLTIPEGQLALVVTSNFPVGTSLHGFSCALASNLPTM